MSEEFNAPLDDFPSIPSGNEISGEAREERIDNDELLAHNLENQVYDQCEFCDYEVEEKKKLEHFVKFHMDRNVPEWIENLVAFYIRICDHFKNGTDPKITIDSLLYQEIDIRLNRVEGGEAKMLFEELVRKIKRQPVLFCSFCNRCMFTARQTFMHIVSIEHTSKLVKDFLHANTLLTKMVNIERVQQMFKDDTEREKSLREKYSSMSLEDPELRPTIAFVESFEEKWSEKVKKQQTGRPHEDVELIVDRMKYGSPYGQWMMKELEKDIGNAKTRCLPCKLIFANTVEYYDHLLTFNHLREADPLDLITMLMNAQKRDLARLEPWPEMPDASHNLTDK